MRRSREQEPIMNVYPPPGEPAVRTDASDFIPCARMTPPRVGRAEGLSFAQLAVQGARIDAGDRLLPALVSRSPAGFVRVEPFRRPHAGPAARISSPARCPAAAASAARCLSCCRMTARMRSTLPARGRD